MMGKNTRETVLVGISVIRREQEIVLPREECPAGSMWHYVIGWGKNIDGASFAY